MSDELITAATLDFERRELRKQRTILLTGDVDTGVAYEFIQDIHLLSSEDCKDPINIIISSPGGSAFAGFAIIRAIRYAQQRGIKVIGSVYGQAMSMAFFILQCCDERRMGRLCVLMAHGVTTGFVGDMRNVEAESKLLTMWQTELSNLVSSRCTDKEGDFCKPKFWFDLLKDNTPQFYSSYESLEKGLIDKIDDGSKDEKDSPQG